MPSVVGFRLIPEGSGPGRDSIGSGSRRGGTLPRRGGYALGDARVAIADALGRQWDRRRAVVRRRRAGRRRLYLRRVSERFAPMRTRSLVGGTVLLLVVASVGAANAGSAQPTGCSQLNKMPSLFPAAKTVGFTKRSVITRSAGRQPIWPGWCSKRIWGTSYSGPKGLVEVRVSLYATAHDVDAALAEPAYGAVQVQANGARMRTTSRATETTQYPGVASAYRNLFISSYSGYEPGPRVPIVVQWRIHRAIEKTFSALP
jgi:hypothetical protein